jgi:hypothetical protein
MIFPIDFLLIIFWKRKGYIFNWKTGQTKPCKLNYPKNKINY